MGTGKTRGQWPSTDVRGNVMGSILVNLSQEENLGLRHGRVFESEVLYVVWEAARRQWCSIRVMLSG